MNCETTHHRLLALPDPARVPDDLRAHLADCGNCRAFAARLGRLDHALTRLPVPASDPAVKAEFLAGVVAGGPIITRIPTIARHDSSVTLTALLKARGRWKALAGLAAGLLVAATAWWGLGGKSTTRPEIAAHRHDLLAKQVRHTAALTQAKDPQARLAVWTDVAADLGGEAGLVHLAAPAQDMTALDKLFHKAVAEGVLKQAKQLPEHMPRAERLAALTAAEAKLAKIATDTDALAATAPPNSKPALENIAKFATQAQADLIKLREGV